MIIGTSYVLPSEPAFNLSEVNLQSPGSRGWRRYQVITVVRNDQLADHKIDLGPAKDFKADQIRIPGGVVDEVSGKIYIEHTVQELQAIADKERLKGPSFFEHGLTPRNIIGGYIEKKEREGKL